MSEIKRYRKKPVVIEAARLTQSNGEALADWCSGQVLPGPLITIPTLEGIMTAGAGDWIIRGVQGEFYPCKNDIFQATYEPECQRLSAFCCAALHGDCSYYQCGCDCHEGENQ